jgi:hypothetical protein
VEGRPLRMSDARFDLTLAIGVTDPARQREDAVVGEHVAIDGIERRVVDVGREHAFFEVVEDATRVESPSRRNARSCSSAQVHARDRHEEFRNN